MKLSDNTSDALSKINDVNDTCSDEFGFLSEIIAMYLEIVNAIDFAVLWRYLVDSVFCTRYKKF